VKIKTWLFFFPGGGLTRYEMSRDAVGEEVDNQDPAGDEQHPSLRVDVIALGAVDVAVHRPGQVGHALRSQLLREILLGKREKSRKSFVKAAASTSGFIHMLTNGFPGL